jgi:hypothetical protein
MDEYRWNTENYGIQRITGKCHWEYIDSLGKTVLVRDE